METKQPLFFSYSRITNNNVPVGESPSHGYTGPGNAERVEGEEGFISSGALLVCELEVVIQHHLRHDEFERDGGVEATRTVLSCGLS